MVGPSDAQLVQVWEAGIPLPQVARAIELLSALEPETSRSGVAALTLGERDRRLLCLRRALFGPVLDATVACPDCGERVEFSVDVESLLVPSMAAPTGTLIEIEGVMVEFRLPTSTDLSELERIGSVVTGSDLMERCVTRVLSHGADEEISFSALSQTVRDAVASKMADLDPQADIQLSMSCPGCRHQWSSDLDVVSYLWEELTTWVKRLLVDVHHLASAYSWREMDILTMSRQRRASYLELIGA